MMPKSQSNSFMKPGDALRVSEAALWLGIQPKTLHTWRSQGRGPKFIRIGKRVRYFERDLIAFVELQNTPCAA